MSRELKRSKVKTKQAQKSGYHAIEASRQTKARRVSANQRFRKITPQSKLERTIIHELQDKHWSPEQIAGVKASHVCKQTVYDWLYAYHPELKCYLHCIKGKYHRTRANRFRKTKRQAVAAKRNISKRPKHVEARKTYGHWERDTVQGVKKSGYIATFVERKSGYLLAVVLPDITSRSFADAMIECFKIVPNKYQKTMTLDNGPEMKACERIERHTNLEVYYANPYHSWERGTIENTNGLLRFYFPKKSSFKDITQEQLDFAVKQLNTRPRKRLGYKTPEQVFKI